MQHTADDVIAGAGVIGLSLALELRGRGRRVIVLDRGTPGLASRAAAGMLAAHDPHNPPELQPLADLALRLYPQFLESLREASGHAVRIQTGTVLECDVEGAPGHTLLPALSLAAGKFRSRPEQSLDPRELYTSLLAAVQRRGIPVLPISGEERDVLPAHANFVDCTGAWSAAHMRPAKGQMLRVRLPAGTLTLRDGTGAVVRTADVYIVPRLDGTALIGATVEDAGFDLAANSQDLDRLRQSAASLVPAVERAPEVERWAGLRPRTADDLPVLGRIHAKRNDSITPHRYVANGLFRNGILLAPAVAHVMTRLLCGEPAGVSLEPFHPDRRGLIRSR